jgi:hypothetical protein
MNPPGLMVKKGSGTDSNYRSHLGHFLKKLSQIGQTLVPERSKLPVMK